MRDLNELCRTIDGYSQLSLMREKTSQIANWFAENCTANLGAHEVVPFFQPLREIDEALRRRKPRRIYPDDLEKLKYTCELLAHAAETNETLQNLRLVFSVMTGKVRNNIDFEQMFRFVSRIMEKKWFQFEGVIEDDKATPKLSDTGLDKLIDYADWLVYRHLCNVKTHQIRRFFEAISNIKMSVDGSEGDTLSSEEQARLLMLRPQFVNASAKDNKLKSLERICTTMIKKISKTQYKKDFENFANFFESLVAFHKAYAKD